MLPHGTGPPTRRELAGRMLHAGHSVGDDGRDAIQLARTLKALADPEPAASPVPVAAHDGGEACVCDLIEPVGSEPADRLAPLKVLVRRGPGHPRAAGRVGVLHDRSGCRGCRRDASWPAPGACAVERRQLTAPACDHAQRQGIEKDTSRWTVPGA